MHHEITTALEKGEGERIEFKSEFTTKFLKDPSLWSLLACVYCKITQLVDRSRKIS